MTKNVLRSLIKRATAKADLMPAQLLRIIVGNMDNTREGLNDRYRFDQLLCIYLAHYLCAWDFYPDQWTARQLREALRGIVPCWNDREQPIYSTKAQS